MQKLVLIDANALIHRAYHALPPLNTSSGEQTNATFGFASMLLKVLNEEKPDFVAVAFDMGRTFRHDEFAAYKAQRPKMAEDLAPQFRRAREIVEAFSFPIFQKEGFEADDVIGTLARQAAQKGIETLIVTGDTDTLQLVGPQVEVMVTRRGVSDTTTYDEAAVRQRYQLAPAQLTDLRGLRGDASDNIPQIPGIGDKTATILLEQYGSVEGIFAHLDEIEPKLRQKLAGYREQALQSKRLAIIVQDVPVTLDPDACRVAAFDRDRVMALFRELEFRSLVERVPAGAPKRQPSGALGGPVQMGLFGEERSPAAQTAEGAPAAPDVVIVDSPPKLRHLQERLGKAELLVVDVESTSPESMTAGLVGIALAIREDEAYYIPTAHLQATQLPLATVLAALRPYLTDAKLPKIAHNAKYDMMVLAQHGVMLQGLASDTMIAAYLLGEKGLGLKDLAFTKLGVTMTNIETLIGRGKEQITMAGVPCELAAPYAGADVVMTLRLHRLFEPELARQDLTHLYREIEIPLVPVLVEMERVGVGIDVAALQGLSRDLAGKIGELEGQIYEAVGHAFNINSTQQLAGVLFEELHLRGTKRTKTGYSTDVSVLEELRGAHEVVDRLLEYRQLVKLKSTYVDSLPLLINPQTGRLHTSYNQTVAATGRLSSSNPNLQNIPVRTGFGRQVRRAFVGQHGRLLLSADYSQIELRILAHVTKDAALLAAFEHGDDIHTATAASVYKVQPAEVTGDMRRVAKTINFGVAYGVSGYGLAQSTGLPQDEATRLIHEYFERYPGIRQYIEDTIRQAHKDGYVSTLLGRRRYLPELKAQNRALVGAGERMAINMPIQGTAADIIKIAMIRLYQALKERAMKSMMILQVHDELVFEAPPEEIDALTPLVCELMEGPIEMDVPLKVDVKVGKNWEEMK